MLMKKKEGGSLDCTLFYVFGKISDDPKKRLPASVSLMTREAGSLFSPVI